MFSSKIVKNLIRKENHKVKFRVETMKFKILVEKLEEVSPKHPDCVIVIGKYGLSPS